MCVYLLELNCVTVYLRT